MDLKPSRRLSIIQNKNYWPDLCLFFSQKFGAENYVCNSYNVWIFLDVNYHRNVGSMDGQLFASLWANGTLVALPEVCEISRWITAIL